MPLHWKKLIDSFDDRRDIVIPGNNQETLVYCVEHFISLAQAAIKDHGFFAVALSGGNTPNAIYQSLANPFNRERINWKNVLLFWGDERNISPDSPESNYHMAMEAGLGSLPIDPKHIFRMPAEKKDIEAAALEYEQTIRQNIPLASFDLVMLGMGEDGHTASLFPKTHGLHVDDDRIVIANFIPQKNVWRMTLTYECINVAQHIAIYILGANKAGMLKHVLTSPYDPDTLPVQRVGTRMHKALWIVDNDAAAELRQSLSKAP